MAPASIHLSEVLLASSMPLPPRPCPPGPRGWLLGPSLAGAPTACFVSALSSWFKRRPSSSGAASTGATSEFGSSSGKLWELLWQHKPSSSFWPPEFSLLQDQVLTAAPPPSSAGRDSRKCPCTVLPPGVGHQLVTRKCGLFHPFRVRVGIHPYTHFWRRKQTRRGSKLDKRTGAASVLLPTVSDN